jgi:hypothetical protein
LGVKEGETRGEEENGAVGASSDAVLGIVVASKAGLVEA